jgi:hypothetical protein
MRHIAQLAGSELEWVQPRALRMEYELRSGGEVVAMLRFRRSWGSFATAQSADGCWTFKRVGFWQTRATVRACGSEMDIATFRQNPWKGGGILELADGRRFLAANNFCQTRSQIQTEDGEPLIRFRMHGFLRMSAEVEIEPAAAEMPEMPWMVLAGWYFAVMAYNDAAATAGAGAAAAG